jgi:hydrogenase expression/formation protein HypC
MCLAVPGEILEITGPDALLRQAQVSFGGTRKEVSLALLPQASVGDYVLVHAGVAIGVVDEEEAARIFDLLEQLEPADEEP